VQETGGVRDHETKVLNDASQSVFGKQASHHNKENPDMV